MRRLLLPAGLPGPAGLRGSGSAARAPLCESWKKHLGLLIPSGNKAPVEDTGQDGEAIASHVTACVLTSLCRQLWGWQDMGPLLGDGAWIDLGLFIKSPLKKVTLS